MTALVSGPRGAGSLITVASQPTKQQELAAISAMVAYLIPQARELSPNLVMLLSLAQHELTLLRAIEGGSVIRLQS